MTISIYLSLSRVTTLTLQSPPTSTYLALQGVSSPAHLQLLAVTS